MTKEFELLNIINQELSDNSYLGDDCAYLKDENLCISTDTLVEDVHFSLDYMMPSEIALKAMLSNISDTISSGAKIKYATISLSGNLNQNFIKEFYQSINKTALKYNFKIIGGDLTKSDKIFINITVFASTIRRNISSRSNAKNGYVVGVVGEFGSSAQGLYNLQNNIKEDYFTLIHKKPILYPDIADKIAKTKKIYAMMDSSDGLVDCIYQMSEKSNVRIDIYYDKIPKKTNNKDYVLYGGEDYCLVGCFDYNEIKDIKEIKIIGKVMEGSGIYLDNQKIEYKGFNHFE